MKKIDTVELIRKIRDKQSEDPEGKSPEEIINLTQDLMGCIEGPADLSTDSSHVANYGR